ncbi:MAG: iron export ABC transporter permease subunit FetB [Polyangiaceae bacterium]|nr:iron export ABC transporter permease subunit FetB [Polyangiaceae bacterium]
MNAIPLRYIDLIAATLLILVAGSVSAVLKLGLGKRLAVASVRSVVQLGLIGFVLEWVFSLERWYLVVAVFASMVVNAGVAAVQRTERRFSGIWQTGLFAVTLSSVVTTFVVVEVVIGVDPWYSPRYVIPLLGMVLGNALTGLSLTLDRVMADLDEKRDQVEGRLALGATIWQACRPHVREAVRLGMVPVLNSMAVVGIVSLPGMMTGQILGGASPIEAVKYQLVVMFMIACATSLGAIAAAMLCFRFLVTTDHQLDVARLRKRG